MTAKQFNDAMRFLVRDCGFWNFPLDLKTYESDESIPKVKGETLSRVFVKSGTEFGICTIAGGKEKQYSAADFDAEELLTIFEEIYYQYMNEDVHGSVEEYLNSTIGLEI